MSFLWLSKFSETKPNKRRPPFLENSFQDTCIHMCVCVCMFQRQRQRQRERGSVCEDLTMQLRTASIQFCTTVPGLRLTACRKFLAVITLCPCLLVKRGFWSLFGIVKTTKVVSQYYAAPFLVNVSVGPTVIAVGVPKCYVKQLVEKVTTGCVKPHYQSIFRNLPTRSISIIQAASRLKRSRKTPSLYMTNEIS